MKITSTDYYKEIHSFHEEVYQQALKRANELMVKYNDMGIVGNIIMSALMSAFINFLIACKIPTNQLNRAAYECADDCINAAINGHEKHVMN